MDNWGGSAPPDPPNKSAASAASSSVATLGLWGPRAPVGPRPGPPLWPGKATSGSLWPQAPPSVAWQGHIRPPLASGHPLCGLARPHQAPSVAWQGHIRPPSGRKSEHGRPGTLGHAPEGQNTKSGLIGVAMPPFYDPTTWFCTEFWPRCSRGTPRARSRPFFSNIFRPKNTKKVNIPEKAGN